MNSATRDSFLSVAEEAYHPPTLLLFTPTKVDISLGKKKKTIINWDSNSAGIHYTSLKLNEIMMSFFPSCSHC